MTPSIHSISRRLSDVTESQARRIMRPGYRPTKLDVQNLLNEMRYTVNALWAARISNDVQ